MHQVLFIPRSESIFARALHLLESEGYTINNRSNRYAQYYGWAWFNIHINLADKTITFYTSPLRNPDLRRVNSFKKFKEALNTHEVL